MSWRWLVAKIWLFEKGNFSENFNAHSRYPAVVDAELSGRASSEVDDSSTDVRTAIVDPHNDGLSGLKIDNSDRGTEGQTLMGSGEGIHIKALTACRSMIPIPRGDACLDAHRL